MQLKKQTKLNCLKFMHLEETKSKNALKTVHLKKERHPDHNRDNKNV